MMSRVHKAATDSTKIGSRQAQPRNNCARPTGGYRLHRITTIPIVDSDTEPPRLLSPALGQRTALVKTATIKEEVTTDEVLQAWLEDTPNAYMDDLMEGTEQTDAFSTFLFNMKTGRQTPAAKSRCFSLFFTTRPLRNHFP